MIPMPIKRPKLIKTPMSIAMECNVSIFLGIFFFFQDHQHIQELFGKTCQFDFAIFHINAVFAHFIAARDPSLLCAFICMRQIGNNISFRNSSFQPPVTPHHLFLVKGDRVRAIEIILCFLGIGVKWG